MNGSTVTSTCRRNSVSASSSPAISAPNAIDSPAAAAANPVDSTTNRQAAMNNSGLRVRATLRNSGRSPSRPSAASAATIATASASARARPSQLPPPSRPLPIAPSRNRIGTTARSWHSRTAKLVRPVWLLMRRSSDSTWVTIAVEDMASASEAISAGPRATPRALNTSASAAVQTATCSAPSPNTSRRSATTRSQESSSPIVNISSTTPRSATCSIRARSGIVTSARAGKRSTSAPSPIGPASTPTII